MTTKKQSSSVPADPATEYAQGVVAGRIVAGPWVRAACQRHLDDLKDGPARGLRWSAEHADRALRFFPKVLRLNGGQFEGKPFRLVGWQSFVVGSLFGWLDADGCRRFRIAYVETGKGSGKSPLAAGIGMFGLVADGEPRAEIYSAATKKDQAMVLFRDAVAMRDLSPSLERRLHKSGTGERAWNLAYLDMGSFFRPISNDDGQSGPRPHIALIDEVHEHKDNDTIEMLRAGAKWRRQPLLLMITNSGTSRNGPCWANHDYAIRVVRGDIQDDSFFGFVCAVDEGEDPLKDEACWPKVNPSLQEAGLPGLKYLRQQVVRARQMPSMESKVRRLNFCQWTDAETPWLSHEIWRKAARRIPWESLRGRRAVAGLDLSSTLDLTALALFVEPEVEGDPWQLYPFAWTPADTLQEREDRDRAPYQQWVDEGWLETTPGKAVSKKFVLQRLLQIAEHVQLVRCAYDRWRIEDLKSLADDDGIALPPMQSFGQTFKDMAPAVDAFETMLVNGELVHNGSPVLSWCIGNAVVQTDAAGNRKPTKAKAAGRVDLAVAGVMAAGMTLLRSEEDNGLDDALADPIFV